MNKKFIGKLNIIQVNIVFLSYTFFNSFIKLRIHEQIDIPFTIKFTAI